MGLLGKVAVGLETLRLAEHAQVKPQAKVDVTIKRSNCAIVLGVRVQSWLDG